jgi:hypothetical protein
MRCCPFPDLWSWYEEVKYQLVMQWPASSIADYAALVAIENVLIADLSSQSVVDGHDAGVGEVNIFLFTDDPQRTFEEIKVSPVGSKGTIPGRNRSLLEVQNPPPGLFLFSV